jgi:hypothetical protein
MAATFVARISGIATRFRKPILATALALSPDGAARVDPTAAPTVSCGAGVPTEAAPNGSTYTRTDASDGDDFLYGRVAGAWVAILGQTA